MAVDIGPKIGIDGEAEFRQQINLLTTQIKTFGSEMQAVTSEFGSNQKSTEALTAKNEVLNKSIEVQSKKLEELKKGLADSERLYGENDTKTLKWQQAVNGATADLNKMKNQVKDNENSMDKLADTVEDTGQAMEGAGNEAVSFGDMLSASLVSDAITGAISSIVSGLKQMMEDSREFRKIMGSLEVSSQAAGYSADQTKQTYKDLYGVLADDQTAATTTANLQALGLAQDDLNKLVDGTVGAWAKYGDSIPIDGLAEAINETAKTGKVTGTFADVLNWAGKSEDDFNDKLSKASTESDRANIILQELTDQGLTGAGEAWQENNKSLVDANKATADFQEITAKMGEAVEPIFTAIQTIINDVLNALMQLTENIDFEGFASQILDFANSITEILQQITDGSITAGEGFSQIIDIVVDALMGIIDTAIEMLPQIIDTGLKISESLITGIMDKLPDIVSKIVEIITKITSVIIEKLPDILAAGVRILKSIIDGVVQTTPQLIGNIPVIFKQLVDAIISNLPQILEMGIKLIGELIAGIIKSIPDIVMAMPKVISGIVDVLKTYDWGEIGKNILKGLANGIVGFVGVVVDAAKEAAGAISNAFQDFFDIHSPSRLMRDKIGKQLPAGIAVGITDNQKEAIKAANSLSSQVSNAFDGVVKGASNSRSMAEQELAKINANSNFNVMSNGNSSAFQQLIGKISDMKVILDTGKTVGSLTPAFNTSLGGYTDVNGRYIS